MTSRAGSIHETARIAPTAIVGDGVEIGRATVVGPGAVLLGPLRIGERSWIGPNCVIGAPPEISTLPQGEAWAGEPIGMGVDIGDDVVIRELSTVHQGSHRVTTVGRGTWLLNSTYVAHDGQVGASVTLSAGVRLGGHVSVGDHANVGMNAVVHQRRVVGPGAMIGMGTPVTADVPPFAKAFGSPARVHGVNEYVLRKLGAAQGTGALIDALHRGNRPDYVDITDDALTDLIRWWAEHVTDRVMRSA